MEKSLNSNGMKSSHSGVSSDYRKGRKGSGVISQPAREDKYTCEPSNPVIEARDGTSGPEKSPPKSNAKATMQNFELLKGLSS